MTLDKSTSFYNSFLKIFEGQLALDRPVIEESGEWGQAFMFQFSQNRPHHCLLILLSGKSCPLSAINRMLLPNFFVEHVFVGRQSAKLSSNSFFSIPEKNISHQLCGHGYIIDREFAVYPDPLYPKILFDYKKSLFHYVELISWLSYSNPAKIFLKKIVLFLTGMAFFNGYCITAFQKSPPLLNYPSPSDFYLFFMADRQISLIFSDHPRLPVSVTKTGETASIKKEVQNHIWAQDKLGNIVPRISWIKEADDISTFELEYVREKDIVGTVSHSFFQKAQLKKQTLSLIHFFETVFFCMEKKQHQSMGRISDPLRGIITAGLDFFKQQTTESDFLQQLNHAIKKDTFLLIPQHGDFCTRNVLYKTDRQLVLIDWEDFELKLFPLVDLCILLISLEDVWGKFLKNGHSRFLKLPEIKHQIKKTCLKMQLGLRLTNENWEHALFLSMAYLAGKNLQKNRVSVAQNIRTRYLNILRGNHLLSFVHKKI